jgi:uridine kinase
MADTYLIGIAGPSGAGKTYLAQHLAAVLNAPVLSMDAYYRDLAHLPLPERAVSNFDHPAAIQHELLIDHVQQLSQGKAVEIPCYDFATHTRTAQTKSFGPADVVIIEGLFTLYWPELRQLLRTKIFVEMNQVVCFERRTLRDVSERGRTRESVQHQFRTTVTPMTDLYVLPTRHNADLVLAGDAAAEETIARVADHMKQQTAEFRVG